MNELAQKINEAKKAGRWMVALFYSSPDQPVSLYRLTADFKVSDFPEAVTLLRRDLEREAARLAEEEKRKIACKVP